VKIKLNKQKINLPDFFIVGASRSGTSSLYFYLREHPEVFMPEEKEPHFFNDSELRSLEDYVKIFHDANYGQIIGEATSAYLYYYKECIKNIKKIYELDYKRLKIITILRNPLERAWSYYCLLRRRGRSSKNIYETIQDLKNKKDRFLYHDFIRSGMYYHQVKSFQMHFPFLKIILFEEFINYPDQILKNIYDFLNLENRDFLPNNLREVYNVSGEPRRIIYKPVYNFLFRNSVIKNVLKPLVPYNYRQKLKTRLAKRIVDKPNMPSDVREYLSPIFKQDLCLLIELFDDEDQVKILRSWIDGGKIK
jgi:hypothetical protein